MPYKEKLKREPSKNPRSKAEYRVTNWSEYNKSLKKRGAITLYFPEGDLKAQFINEIPYVEGVSGQESTYSTAYIELIYTFYKLLGWGIRQTTGFLEDMWRNKGLDIKVPSFGHLSDLFSKLSIKVKQFCNKLSRKLKDGDEISLIIDSTGMRFGRASEWYEIKYNKPCTQRPWKKMHLSIDLDMNIRSIEITDNNIADSTVMDRLVDDSDVTPQNVLADGAYYSIDKVQSLYDKGITPVIPPPSHSVVHNTDSATWHNQIVEYIQNKGIYAFQKKYGYNLRALVESQISRIKKCIGNFLQTRRTSSQKTEGVVIANIINLWNSFGRPVSVKIG